jgi:hypothetical protein
MASATNKRRKRETRELAERFAAAGVVEQADPLETLQHVLDRCFKMLVFTETEVESLTDQEFWRDTMSGKLPNEWIRLEQDLRNEVSATAGKMVALGIAERRMRASEVIAAAIAPALDGILRELKLSKAQRKLAPQVVERHLKLIEGNAEERVAA